MALSIKDDKLEGEIRDLARERKTSLTGAIRLAIDNMRDNERQISSAERDRRWRALTRLSADVDRSKLDWSLTDDEILGYDEHGLPT